MKKLKSLIANTLQVDEDSLKDETLLETLDNWDSFNSLLLISEVEKAYNITLDINDVMDVKDIKDIKRVIKKHGGNINEE